MAKAPKVRGIFGGRPKQSSYGVDPEKDPPTLWPYPESYVRAVNSSPLIKWDNPRRAAYHRLVALAKELGLSIQEFPDTDNDQRNRWVEHRVDLSYALGTIKDHPGITFEDFVWDPYMRGQPLTPVAYKAAKGRARSAMQRLLTNGAIVKRSWPGEPLRLWAVSETHAVPEAGGPIPDLSRAVPEYSRAMRLASPDIATLDPKSSLRVKNGQ